MDVTAALFARLAGDGELAAQLADYRGQPAIFTGLPVPPDARAPYLVTAGNGEDRPLNARGLRLRRLVRAIDCYAPAEGSAAALETLAGRVRDLLHDADLPLAGARVLAARCSGPVATGGGRDATPGLAGRRLTLSLLIDVTPLLEEA